jgi:hypothetical protein
VSEGGEARVAAPEKWSIAEMPGGARQPECVGRNEANETHGTGPGRQERETVVSDARRKSLRNERATEKRKLPTWGRKVLTSRVGMSYQFWGSSKTQQPASTVTAEGQEDGSDAGNQEDPLPVSRESVVDTFVCSPPW